MECNISENQEKCACTFVSCSRQGRCCECISHHLELDELPGCAFPPEVEKTYDRSFSRFVQAYQARHAG